IQRMLDKNSLMICYNANATAPETLLASRNRAATGGTKLRAQNSPLPQAEGGRRITMPEPAIVGVRTPEVASADVERPATQGRKGWTSPVSARTTAGQTSAPVSVASRASRTENGVGTQPRRDDESDPVETEMQMESRTNDEDVVPE